MIANASSLPLQESAAAAVPHALRQRAASRRTFLNAIPLDAITESECVEAILQGLDHGRGGFVVTHNLDHIRRLEFDTDFASICAHADLRVADGMPVVWLSRMLRRSCPERVAGSSLLYSLSAAAAGKGRSIYLLGGDEGTAEAAAEALKKISPDLKIAGAYYLPHGFEHSDQAVAEVVRRLKAAAPDIIYVALGSPKQEVLILRLRKHLPNAWWLGVGISFSYACGRVKRAPKWVQDTGAEWIFRMLQEPRRLIGRYLGSGIPFALWLFSRCMLNNIKADRKIKHAPSPNYPFTPAPPPPQSKAA